MENKATPLERLYRREKSRADGPIPQADRHSNPNPRSLALAATLNPIPLSVPFPIRDPFVCLVGHQVRLTAFLPFVAFCENQTAD